LDVKNDNIPYIEVMFNSREVFRNIVLTVKKEDKEEN